MAVNIEVRRVESPVAAEIYISVTPRENTLLQKQAIEIFSAIRGILHPQKTYILQERVFATEGAKEEISHLRSKSYGELDDGVAPSFLSAKEGALGPVAGVQVHAVSSNTKPEVINLGGIHCGRILRMPGHSYLTLSSVSTPQFTTATRQARAMMEKAESALKQFGADFFSVPRTWIWMRDILSWYGDFNRVRTNFFIERGLIGTPGNQSMPASTGIGLADGSLCAMDLIAILEPMDSIQYLPAIGKQQSALKYGSAFSRACRAVTPAGETIFISGTASIDATGATTNIDDASGQIKTTIENVRAVLRDMQCKDEDVMQVMTYCKTAEVQKIFNNFKGELGWPVVTAICDICRPELLFEVEVTAMPKKNKSKI